MQLYGNLDELPDTPLEPVATLGNFDGVHRGHQAILSKLKMEAERLNVPSMVITFYPHPRQVLRPQEPFLPIMSLKERLRRLWDLGIDHILVLPFDHDMAELTAQEFVDEVLWEKLRVTAMYVGPYTQFGHNREGDVKFLESAGRRLGFSVGEVDPIYVSGKRVSSSWAREAVTSGQLDHAARILGRHFQLAGEVIEGDKRGREMGYPTANIAPSPTVLPRAGVYAAWATLPDGSRKAAAVNLGIRPTFDGQSPLIEAHILDYEGELYGEELFLSLMSYVRPETKFTNAKQLRLQIRRDLVEVKRSLGLLKK
jgi:riboflavin kinase/FMN adenylyltransferase